jgi:hypothetical protein
LPVESSTPVHESPTSKVQNSTNGSSIRSVKKEAVVNHEARPQNSANGRPQHSKHRLANDTPSKNRGVSRAISSPKSTNGTGLHMAPMSPTLSSGNLYRLPIDKPPSTLIRPGETSISNRNGRSIINPQRKPKPQVHQSLSKNQLRRLKKKQRRLQIGKGGS